MTPHSNAAYALTIAASAAVAVSPQIIAYLVGRK